MSETTAKKSVYGSKDRRKRGREKIDDVVRWVAEYRYSTVQILSRMLGVNPGGQGAFFKRLVDQGILQRVSAPRVNAMIYLLTQEGKQMAWGMEEKYDSYRTEPSKITFSVVNHNLCMQLAVLERLKTGMVHTCDRYLYFTDRDKLPDVLLEFEGKKTALEIELEPKNINRVYRAFYDHINAMRNGHYDRVEYVFSTATLCNRYKAKFDASEWPKVERKAGKLRQAEGVFEPDKIKGLRERFTFVVQNFDSKK